MQFKIPGCHQFLISLSRGLKSLSKRLQPGGQTHRGRKIKTLPNIASSCIQSRNTFSYFLRSELYVHFYSSPGLLSTSVYTWIQKSNGWIVSLLSSVHLLEKKSTPARIHPLSSVPPGSTLQDTPAQSRKFLYNISPTKIFLQSSPTPHSKACLNYYHPKVFLQWWSMDMSSEVF